MWAGPMKNHYLPLTREKLPLREPVIYCTDPQGSVVLELIIKIV